MILLLTPLLSVFSMAWDVRWEEVILVGCVDALNFQKYGNSYEIGNVRSILLALVLAVVTRISVAAATLLHEWFHLLFATWLSLTRGDERIFRLREIWSPSNISGNVDFTMWSAALQPFSRLPQTFNPRVELKQVETLFSHETPNEGGIIYDCTVRSGNREKARPAISGDSVVAVGGWLLSVSLAALVARMKPNSFELVQLVKFAQFAQLSSIPTNVLSDGLHFSVALGLVVCAVCCTATDILGRGSLRLRQPLPGRQSFLCGNFGLVMETAADNARRGASDALQVLEEMAAISSERGGQSGGLVTLFHYTTPGCRNVPRAEEAPAAPRQVAGLRVRVIPGKRESLSRKLIGRFRLRLATLAAWDRIQALVLAICHALRLRSSGLDPSSRGGGSVAAGTGKRGSAELTQGEGEGRGSSGCESGEAGLLRRPGGTESSSSTECAAARGDGESLAETRPNEDSSEGVEAGRAGGRDEGPRGQRVVQVFAGHTRFATSSIPSVGETHPHRWSPERRVRMWRHRGGSRLLLDEANLGLYVTHNGDFEFWSLFGRDRTHTELGPWLEVVLGSPQPAHCDSVMVAGLMELLRTQGIWAAAIRLAYHQVVMTSYEEVFDSDTSAAIPSPTALDVLGAAADAAFGSFLEKFPGAFDSELSVPALESVPCGRAQLEEELLDTLRSPETTAELKRRCGSGRGGESPAMPRLLTDLSLRAAELLTRQAVDNFFGNDLFAAARQFLTRAKGSFGLCICSTVDCDRVVLAAMNQPLSLGLAPAARLVLYSSECHSLTVPLPGSFTPSPVATKLAGSPSEDDGVAARVAYRFDLDENDGEIVEICLGGGSMVPTRASPPGHGGKGPHTAGGAPGSAYKGDSSAPAAAAAAAAAADAGPGASEAEGGGGEEKRGAFSPAPEVSFLRPLLLPELPGISLRLFNVRAAQMMTPADVVGRRRLVPVAGNPAITLKESRRAAGPDLVAADLRDVPRVLEAIRRDWQEEGSANRRAGAALVSMLKEKARAKEAAGGGAGGAAGSRAIDVLVTGVECSLWVGEQFAADLQNCFPQLRVVPVSANKVIGVMGNARGAISASGFSFTRMVSSLSPSDAIVVAISQSGQTFPTLHATRILAKHCPGRVFVCVGMLDSKMAAAVGQSLDPASVPCDRVFHTHAGWRSAEPASVSVAAAHATLTELLLLAARELRADAERGAESALLPSPAVGGENPEGGHSAQATEGQQQEERQQKLQREQRRPLGLRLTARDVDDLERMRDAAVLRSVPDIVGWREDGRWQQTDVNKELRKQGWKWAQHILETPWAWALAAAYIFVTVPLGYPLFTAIRKAAGGPDHTALAYVLLVLDSGIYLFLPLIMALFLRLLQQRELLARIGKRTLVIADVPWVHQALEEFVSKLFALSFWIASVDVHGANPMDHFVHRFTHRVTRGTLIAVGRPDGRLCSQTKCESWVLMALLQARTILNLGTGAEAVTVGHNPYSNATLIRRHVTLPSNRPKFLCEKLLGVDDVEPLKRLASRSHAMSAGAGRNAFRALDQDVVGLHLCDESAVDRARSRGLAMLAHGMRDIEESDADDPTTRDSVLSGMALDVQRLLQIQVGLEDFAENRFLSLERFLAFQVMFHRMASAVASCPFLWFNVSRSQSRLRIATTAAPISAADLEREWLDSISDMTVYRGHRGGAAAAATAAAGGPDASLHRHQRGNPSFHRLSDALHALFPHRGGHSQHHPRGGAELRAFHSTHGGSLWRSPGHSLHGIGGSSGLRVSPLDARHAHGAKTKSEMADEQV